MLRTSKQYNHYMDSMLTHIFNQVSTSDLQEIDSIKHDQSIYYNKRKASKDSLFLKAEIIFDQTGIYPQLEEMIANQELGDMNYHRALTLIDLMRKL